MVDTVDYSTMTREEAIAALDRLVAGTEELTNAQLRDVQTLLNQAGYNAGTPDGFEGPKTGNALAQFMRNDSNVLMSGLNPMVTRIVETYATAENVQNFHMLYGPIRYDRLSDGYNTEASQTVASLLDGPLNDNNTIRLQQALVSLGLSPGSVDGDFGSFTAGATLNYLKENHNVLLNMNSDNLEFILDQANPEDLARFQNDLRESPEFYDMLRSKIDAVGGDLSTASREQLMEIQQLMTAGGFYNRGIDGVYGRGTQAGLDAFNAMERPVAREPLRIEVTPQPTVTEAGPETIIPEVGPPLEEGTAPLRAAEPIDVTPLEPAPEPAAEAAISTEEIQSIYDTIVGMDPELVRLASVNTRFVFAQAQNWRDAETAYQTGFDDDSTTMRELSELEEARLGGRLGFSFPFESMFTPEEIGQVKLEVERLSNGMHPQTGAEIQRMEINGQTYILGALEETGLSAHYRAAVAAVNLPAGVDADSDMGPDQRVATAKIAPSPFGTA